MAGLGIDSSRNTNKLGPASLSGKPNNLIPLFAGINS